MQRREKGASVEEGQWGTVGGERRRDEVRRKEEKKVQGKEDKENQVRNEQKNREPQRRNMEKSGGEDRKVNFHEEDVMEEDGEGE